MLPLALKIGGIAAGSLLGLNMIGKLFGNDPDFTMAWQMRMMSGQGAFSAFASAMFKDGIGKMFWGSRTASAMMSRGGMGAHLYGSPFMAGMNPYMANPHMMGGLPYSPMGFGAHMWGW